MYLALYVDDCILASDSLHLLTNIKDKLKLEFDMVDFEEMQVDRTEIVKKGGIGSPNHDIWLKNLRGSTWLTVSLLIHLWNPV